MRKEQNIFVGFSQFADNIQALLDFCIAGRDSMDESNRFISTFDSSVVQSKNGESLEPSATFEIFEHNEFRNLLHLRLEFTKANHEETSSWLAKKLVYHRKLNIDLQ